jgi:FkbM family methyltransferase
VRGSGAVTTTEVIFERARGIIRLGEARLTPRRRQIAVDGRVLSLVRSTWWDNTAPDVVASEIEPYWDAIGPRRDFRTVIDAGADVGLFSLHAAVRLPSARIIAFEPSLRQRTLLRRNLAQNGLAGRVVIEPLALWHERARLPFRTHGAISGVTAAAEQLAGLTFAETAAAEPLDAWAARTALRSLDLLKMDIEGAELEALEGARAVLTRYRPLVLIQAYHARGDARTLERCVSFLNALGYRCAESVPGAGLVRAEAEP